MRDGERHLPERPVEVPVLGAGVLVADDLDVARVAAAEPALVREPDELDRQRVHAHQPGGDRVDRHLIGARQDDVLHTRNHAARPGAVAGERAVHHREHAAMDLLLNHQQVDERFVDDRVRPVAALVQQPAERVLHRAGHRREDVRLDRRQMNDVLADEPARNHEPLRVHLVQAEEVLRQIADGVVDVDPLFAFVDVDVAQPVRLDDRELLVLALAQVRVDHDRPVVARVDQIRRVAVLLHGANHALELPGGGRAARKEEVPRDVDLQRGVGVFRDHVLVAGEVQQPVVVAEDGLGPWSAGWQRGPWASPRFYW